MEIKLTCQIKNKIFNLYSYLKNIRNVQVHIFKR
jgi:hypothetical protein